MPEVGRFASPDTLVPDPGNPQSFNRYSYTNNYPVNYTDPSGHCIVAYSGDVRMDEGPYGTSGLCPNTESPLTEGTAAIDAIHNDPDFATPTEDLLLYYIGGPIIILGAPAVIQAIPLIVPALASGGSAVCADGDCTNELSHFARAAEYGIRSTKELRSLIKGSGLQAHHIIEQRFASTIGAKTQEMLSVALTPEEHQTFTNA